MLPIGDNYTMGPEDAVIALDLDDRVFDAAGQPTEKWKAIERLLGEYEADLERARCLRLARTRQCIGHGVHHAIGADLGRVAVLVLDHARRRERHARAGDQALAASASRAPLARASVVL